MSLPPLPSAEEKADACDRFVDVELKAHALLHEMRQIVAEGRANVSQTSHPKFPFIGRDIEGHLSAAQDALWKAHKIVAVDGYDNRRKALSREDPKP